jgi:hypothetical protein
VNPSPTPVVLPSPGGPAARVLSIKEMTREAKLEARKLGPREPPLEVARPKTRGDCEGGERPCPFVGCRHHTLVDVSKQGSLKLLRPDVDPADAVASCSLDIADAGAITLEKVAAVMNVTRERARQIEEMALTNAAAALADEEVRMFRGSCKAVDAFTGLKCRLPAHASNVPHRSERGVFRFVAMPGQTRFAQKEQLERASVSNPGEEPYVGH